MRKLMLVAAMLAIMMVVAAPAMAHSNDGGDAFTGNIQNAQASFGDQNATVTQTGDDNNANVNQSQSFKANQSIKNITAGGNAGWWGDGGDAFTLNLQNAQADFDGQNATVTQAGDGNSANVNQSQSFKANQSIKNLTLGGSSYYWYYY